MFYTALRWVPNFIGDDESDGESEGDDNDTPLHLQRMRWSRKSLFKASRGEIGLIWSIFRLLGTPTEVTWPDFRSLPGAKMISFTSTPPVSLRSRLVNLPPLQADVDMAALAHPLNLIEKLIVLNPTRRLSASDALQHPWFMSGVPLILPPGHATFLPKVQHSFETFEEWNGCTLRDIFRPGVENAYAGFNAAL